MSVTTERDIVLKCPVCEGKGEGCKSCDGKGLLWGKEIMTTGETFAPVVPFPVPQPFPAPFPAPFPSPFLPPSWPYDRIIWTGIGPNTCSSASTSSVEIPGFGEFKFPTAQVFAFNGN